MTSPGASRPRGLPPSPPAVPERLAPVASGRARPIFRQAPALALLLVAAFGAPEVTPAGRFALLLAGVATAAALLGAARPPSRRNRALLLLALVPVVAAAAAAADRGAAVSRVADLALFAVAFWAGRDLLPSRRRAGLAWALAICGSLTAAHGVYQRAFGFARDLASLPSLDLPEAPIYALRLRTGRVFATFLLPSAFAGFLILTLPATLALALGARRRPGRRAALGAMAALQAVALLLTQSQGALAALALATALVAVRAGPRARRVAAVGAVACALGFGGVLLVRGEPLLGPEGRGNPGWERWENWRAAWTMAADSPLCGVGWGSFGAAYPQVQRPGTNQTRYAHNSYLQVIAEAGWTTLPFLVLLLGGAWSALGPGGKPAAEACLALGAAAVLIHNLGDFTLLLPSVAIPFCLLAGSLAPRSDGAAGGAAWARGGPAVLGLLLVLALPPAAARLEADRARAALLRGSPAAATAEMGLASHLDPLTADYPDFLARLELEHGAGDAASLARARAEAENACWLDRRTPHHRTTLELVCTAQGDAPGAVRAALRAAALFPASPEYASRVTRLRAALEGR